MSIDFDKKAPATPEAPRKKKRKISIGHYAVNGWLIFWAIFSVIPMLWLILAPSKTVSTPTPSISFFTTISLMPRGIAKRDMPTFLIWVCLWQSVLALTNLL